jgi:hypothetical protein
MSDPRHYLVVDTLDVELRAIAGQPIPFQVGMLGQSYLHQSPRCQGFPAVFGESREEYIERLRNTPTHLCRLRYFGDENRWSMALYTYSHEKYEPCIFNNGTFHGTPEEGFDTAAVYLQD